METDSTGKTKATTIRITATANFFSGYGRETLPVVVELGTEPAQVRVWDSVGKIYTTCHALSPRGEARIAAKARKLGGAS